MSSGAGFFDFNVSSRQLVVEQLTNSRDFTRTWSSLLGGWDEGGGGVRDERFVLSCSCMYVSRTVHDGYVIQINDGTRSMFDLRSSLRNHASSLRANSLRQVISITRAPLTRN